MGATTVWERWDSLLPDGSVNPGEMTSFNHYALGAVADWLHRTVAGLAPDAPGYRRIRIAPRPLGALSHARAEHRTPYGPASVAWRREGDDGRGHGRGAAEHRRRSSTCRAPSRSVVGSGRHEWRFTERADAASRRPLGLDSPSAAIIDDPEAYRVLLDTLAAHDPARAEAVRVDTVWAEGRPLRQALMFTPPERARRRRARPRGARLSGIRLAARATAGGSRPRNPVDASSRVLVDRDGDRTAFLVRRTPRREHRMTVKLHQPGLRQARSLVRDGKVVRDERDDWSEDAPTPDEENAFIEEHGWAEYGHWHLGVDDDEDRETKGHYKFPYGDFTKVHRCGVISLESRAGQFDHDEIRDEAKKLLELIDEG